MGFKGNLSLPGFSNLLGVQEAVVLGVDSLSILFSPRFFQNRSPVPGKNGNGSYPWSGWDPGAGVLELFALFAPGEPQSKPG